MLLLRCFTEDSVAAATQSLRDLYNILDHPVASVQFVGVAIGMFLAKSEQVQAIAACFSVHQQVLAMQLESTQRDAKALGVALHNLAGQSPDRVFAALRDLSGGSSELLEKSSRRETVARSLFALLKYAVSELPAESTAFSTIHQQLQQCNSVGASFQALVDAAQGSHSRLPTAAAQLLATDPGDAAAAACAAQPWQALSEPPSPNLPSPGTVLALFSLHEWSNYLPLQPEAEATPTPRTAVLLAASIMFQQLARVFAHVHPSRRWMRRLHCDSAHLALRGAALLHTACRLPGTPPPSSATHLVLQQQAEHAAQTACASLYTTLLPAAWLFAPAATVAAAVPALPPGSSESASAAGGAAVSAGDAACGAGSSVWDAAQARLVPCPPRNTSVPWSSAALSLFLGTPAEGSLPHTAAPPSSAASGDTKVALLQWVESMQRAFHSSPSPAPGSDVEPASKPCATWQDGITHKHLLSKTSPAAADPNSTQHDRTALYSLVAWCRALDGNTPPPDTPAGVVDMASSWAWLLQNPPPGHAPLTAAEQIGFLSRRHELCLWPLPRLSAFHEAERDVLLAALTQGGWAAS